MNIKIDKKRFMKNYRIAQDVFNTSIVIRTFCVKYKDIEEIVNITPIMTFLCNQADKLCYDLFNIKHGFDENGNKIKN